MGIFGRKANQPKSEPWQVDATTEVQEGNGLTRGECRACSGGEGICEYHANMFRRSAQRHEKIYRKHTR